MMCDKCKNKPWRECCNDCKELDYCCHKCKDIVKVKDYIKHLGDHYANPNQYLEFNMCKVFKHISFLGLEMEDADCASTLTDIDTHIPNIVSRNMSKDLIEKFRVKLVFCADYPRSGFIHPQSGFTDFRKLFLRACYTVSLVILKNTDHCVSTDLSVFDCIPITVCPIYSLTAGIILFKNCEFVFFYLT